MECLIGAGLLRSRLGFALSRHPATGIGVVFQQCIRRPDATLMTAPLSTDAFEPAQAALTRRGVLILRTQRERDRRILLLACAIAAALFAGALALAYLLEAPGDASAWSDSSSGAEDRMMLPAPVKQSAVIYDTAVMPLAPEEASAINASRPLDVAKVVPARALRIAAESAAGLGFEAALRCMTQAVYYEAASEADTGQRAVAQVVLNRVRHPAFPNTVCGVVYQGSERVTGCQFSFTCDGSLARVPSISGWARAERVARDAFAGRVAAAVGNATHYHADYVVPYWAPTLDKAATIGAHIFYIMRGFLGSPRAFSGRYDVALEAPPGVLVAPGMLAGEEPGALAPLAPEIVLTPQFGAPVEDARSGDLTVGRAARGFDWSEAAPLRADEERGELRTGKSGALKVDDSVARGAAPGDAAAPPES